MQPLLYILFILSGAAGLMYESIWSKYLGLFVGHSAYAQIIVIAIFLGGMSWGAYVVGRRSASIKEPLVWYAYVEVIVGLIGLLFHDIFVTVSGIAYDSVFPAMAGSPFLGPVKWGIAALLILPQSFLLGTTFPLMSAGVIRVVRNAPGRVLSLLYFSNSLGAAMGVLIAGFVLVRMAGLPGTILAAAITNIVVGIVALATVRYVIPAHLDQEEKRAEEARKAGVSVAPVLDAAPAATSAAGVAGDPAYAGKVWRLLLALSFGTAIASFIYEIAWIRMLSLVLGSASHSFELMLSAFILGLALGAFWVRKRADRFTNPVSTLGYVQLVMGAAALATLPIYLWSFDGAAGLMSILVRNDGSYGFFTVARYLFCLAVMLPATFCAGITLPLITRTLLTSEKGEQAIGAVYSINTLGSIIGVAAAGLVIMPLLGLKFTLILAAAIDMGLGITLLAFTGKGIQFAHPRALGAAAVAGVMLIAALVGARFDEVLLTSGVFRTGTITRAENRDVVFMRDGRTASVSVTKIGGDSLVVIATNGKPDASLRSYIFRDGAPDTARKEGLAGDASTQFLVPLVALAHVPNAKLGAMIGHGSGISSHALLAAPSLEKLYTIEIEPQMIEGSRFFYPANKRVFDDPRSEFIIDDAKSYFAATGQKFDIIISEPSNPWVSGVAGLFTHEFYKRVTRYMADDGIFAQWLHVYEISDGLVLSVLAALHRTFPSYDVFQTSGGDILIVASLKDKLPTPDWKVFDLPEVQHDLRNAVKYDSLTLEATRLLSRTVLEPLLDSWTESNSDFFPVLDLGAERTRFLHESASGFSAMWQQGFNVAAALMNRRAGQYDDKLAVLPGLGSVYTRAASARARRGGPVTKDDSTDFPAYVQFHHSSWAFGAIMAAPDGPKNWNRWTADFIRMEDELHRGTSGFVDSSFYVTAERFIRKHQAPANVVQAVRFLRGVAEWNYPEAAAAADSLSRMDTKGREILAPDFLRDGGVIAKLRTGDVAGAETLYRRLATSPGLRPATHFQSRLLDAHLRAAMREKGLAGR